MQRPTDTCLAILAAAYLLIAGVSAAGAQAEQPGVFAEVIDVRVINLEVVVTENGDRVTGLGPDDFTLTVDGREVAIEYFTEVLGGTAIVPDGENVTVPALAPGEEVGTSYLVFIDEYFSRPTERDRILQRMVDQLPNLLPQDRMAVVAYDGKKVEMLSTWSQSVESLERVFKKAQQRRAFGLQREAERRIFDLDRLDGDDFLGDAEGRSNFTGLDLEERQLADRLENQVQRVVVAATSTLRSFANPPGRKVMLLLSGGWPYNPAYWVVNDPERAIYVASDVDTGDELYRPLTETANRLSYTLYTVDVPGIDSSQLGAEIGTLDQAVSRTDLGRDREWQEELTLNVLARDTGGRALIDGASLDALQRVVEDTRSYYWIGFTPDWKGDDASHKVRVTTRNKGQKIRARKGFSDLSRETEVTMTVESSLLFGSPPSAAPLQAALGPGKRSGRGKVIAPLKVLIPIYELTFLPQRDGWFADTELRVAVLDEDGNASDIPVIPVGLRVEEEPKEGVFTVFETNLKLRKKKHDLVVSLYDRASGKILSTKIEVDPGSGR